MAITHPVNEEEKSKEDIFWDGLKGLYKLENKGIHDDSAKLLMQVFHREGRLVRVKELSPGDHIVWNRDSYYHHAIVVEPGVNGKGPWVIHFTPVRTLRKVKVKVILDQVNFENEQGTLCKLNYLSCDSEEIVLARAFKLLLCSMYTKKKGNQGCCTSSGCCRSSDADDDPVYSMYGDTEDESLKNWHQQWKDQQQRNDNGDIEYHILWNNCEHVSTWCKTGNVKSSQVMSMGVASFTRVCCSYGHILVWWLCRVFIILLTDSFFIMKIDIDVIGGEVDFAPIAVGSFIELVCWIALTIYYCYSTTSLFKQEREILKDKMNDQNNDAETGDQNNDAETGGQYNNADTGGQDDVHKDSSNVCYDSRECLFNCCFYICCKCCCSNSCLFKKQILRKTKKDKKKDQYKDAENGGQYDVDKDWSDGCYDSWACSCCFNLCCKCCCQHKHDKPRKCCGSYYDCNRAQDCIVYNFYFRRFFIIVICITGAHILLNFVGHRFFSKVWTFEKYDLHVFLSTSCVYAGSVLLGESLVIASGYLFQHLLLVCKRNCCKVCKYESLKARNIENSNPTSSVEEQSQQDSDKANSNRTSSIEEQPEQDSDKANSNRTSSIEEQPEQDSDKANSNRTSSIEEQPEQDSDKANSNRTSSIEEQPEQDSDKANSNRTSSIEEQPEQDSDKANSNRTSSIEEQPEQDSDKANSNRTSSIEEQPEQDSDKANSNRTSSIEEQPEQDSDKANSNRTSSIEEQPEQDSDKAKDTDRGNNVNKSNHKNDVQGPATETVLKIEEKPGESISTEV